jgi:uncharacterized Ntn-hydrolase superfamily protein
MVDEFHTYSIVARDPETGQLGVGVQSHAFGVGRVVTWAEAGVGAVATQAVADPSFGPLGLDLLRAGVAPDAALAELLSGDSMTDVRQVGMIDGQGRVAAHTGARCIAAAGHRRGRDYSAQANMMLRDTVWTAMGNAFEGANGDLAERIIVSLEAAEREGGDLRGMQSASLLVVGGPASSRRWEGRLFDLRVDDHAEPLAELRRLMHRARAIRHMGLAVQLLSRPDRDGDSAAQAQAEFAQADRHLEAAGGYVEPVFWYAVGLAGAGLVDEALPHFKRVFSTNERYRELARRLPPTGRVPDDPAVMARILGV